MDPRASRSFAALVRARAAEHPERRAFTFVGDGTSEASLGYGALDAQARAIAGALQAAGFGAGSRALLVYPPGLEFVSAFLGCLYGGIVAVPAYPPDPARLGRTLPRLQGIVADAGATVALTTGAVLGAAAEALFAHAPDLGALRWLATDGLPAGSADHFTEPGAGPATIALLQYTSGSTAAPRGVMLSHGNLLANSAAIEHAFGHGPDMVGVVWAPFYHDLGLVGGILQPLWLGTPSVLMSPVSFLHRPIRWLRAISRWRATTSGGPNFAYDLCVDRTRPAEREGLDLSSWRVAFNAAEPVRRATLERFAATFAPFGFRPDAFYPCYGLAEATLIASGGRVTAPPVTRRVRDRALGAGTAVASTGGEDDARWLVGSGGALPGHRLRVVDPATATPCPERTVGEVWVAGPSVGAGYWRQRDATRRTFCARLADGDGPFLRTGDLGFLDAGELFVTGRLKDVVFVRGRNLYPQDLEETAEACHPALRRGCSAAFAVEADDREALVLVHEVDPARAPALAGVAGAVRDAISLKHDVRVDAVALIAPRSIPKTSSGKIQRHACRAEFLAGTLALLGPVT
jgi:acyl-CoA synthetase (AMP-forming)/AMP-acid ligase II